MAHEEVERIMIELQALKACVQKTNLATNDKIDKHIDDTTTYRKEMVAFMTRVEPALSTFEKTQGAGWVATKIAIFTATIGGAYIVIRNIFWQ